MSRRATGILNQGFLTHQIFAFDLLFSRSVVFGGAARAGAGTGAIRIGCHRRREEMRNPSEITMKKREINEDRAREKGK